VCADDAGGKTFFLKLQPPVQRVFDVIKAIPATSIFASAQELDEYLDTLQSQERDDL
jgi:anti-sigma B factor antagonist